MKFRLYYHRAERKWTLFFSGQSHIMSEIRIDVPVTTVIRASGPNPRAYVTGDASFISIKGGRAHVV